jgi:hypothetical protein
VVKIQLAVGEVESKMLHDGTGPSERRAGILQCGRQFLFG